MMPADTRRPIEPTRPEPGECCGSGCDPCVFELYERAMEEYRSALAAWQARDPVPPDEPG